ncbi:MAG: hypothetical protein Q4F81_02360 [Eubacteriales bacterium]|nr:hypothetical protein [Eubacteriales bacterium]
MKKMYIGMLLALLLTSVCLGACGKREIPERYPTAPSVPATETELPQTPQTLEDLLGEDYVQFLTDTITMQMGNRMDKNPDVQYFPIIDKAPLGDYVTIGKETEFEVDDEGYLVILLPAGAVTSADNGAQRFRVYQVDTNVKARNSGN